jgi:hypothetical protein
LLQFTVVTPAVLPIRLVLVDMRSHSLAPEPYTHLFHILSGIPAIERGHWGLNSASRSFPRLCGGREQKWLDLRQIKSRMARYQTSNDKWDIGTCGSGEGCVLIPVVNIVEPLRLRLGLCPAYGLHGRLGLIASLQHEARRREKSRTTELPSSLAKIVGIVSFPYRKLLCFAAGLEAGIVDQMNMG